MLTDRLIKRNAYILIRSPACPCCITDVDEDDDEDNNRTL